MTPPTDPYRKLGLARGATLDDVKRAYRALAKVNHPDVAGPAALPRFLAIRAAYEQLIADPAVRAARARPTRATRPATTPPDGSSTDATGRGEASQRAYGGRTRRGRGTTSTGSATGGSAGASGGRARSGSGSGSASRSSTGGRDAGTTDHDAPPGKATLGSTSYDGADAGPFEPDWGGASWYGTTSGTYWTINPKEYADPRKHGPEYQARARRQARARSGIAASGASASRAPGGATTTGQADASIGPDPEGGPDASASHADPTHTTASWWDSTAGSEAPGDTATQTPRSSSGIGRDAARTRRSAASTTSTAEPPPPDLAAAAADLGRALTDERTARGKWRLVQAVVGWLPIVFGLGWLIGELTGCGRFAASCGGGEPLLAPAVSIAVLGLLVAVPSLAALAATATVAIVVAAVPTALILSAGGEAVDGASRSATLGGVIVVAWVGGLALAVARRVRDASSSVGRAGPVS